MSDDGLSDEARTSFDEGRRVTVRDLDGATRGLFAFGGASGLVLGAVAVFLSANQAGTVALLIAGSGASLLAVVGKVPLRWVIGGTEFDMSYEQAAALVEGATADLTPGETAAFASRLSRLQGGVPSSITGVMLDNVSFELEATARVRLAVTQAGWNYREEPPGQPHRFDGYIDKPEGPSVPVELRMHRGTSSLWPIVSRLRLSAESLGCADVLLVVSGGTEAVWTGSTQWGGELEGPRVHVIDINTPGFERVLIATLETAFSG